MPVRPSLRHPLSSLRRWIGRGLSHYLSGVSDARSIAVATDAAQLMACLQPGDVLLVEGHTRVSVAIKYLTQSTWSHAALYVGTATGQLDDVGLPRGFVEADLRHGVRAVSVTQYHGLLCRVCRPMGLCGSELETVINFAVQRLGLQYDLQNVIDLARYLLPTPPVPVRWRRRMIAFGSGDPTRAICSTLIAQAFQAVRYPILPIVEAVPAGDPDCPNCVKEILQVRHHSLFVPRDFDVSPYFDVIKPTLAPDFDYRQLNWHDKLPAAAA